MVKFIDVVVVVNYSIHMEEHRELNRMEVVVVNPLLHLVLALPVLNEQLDWRRVARWDLMESSDD
jgi:hypothetical protein